MLVPSRQFLDRPHPELVEGRGPSGEKSPPNFLPLPLRPHTASTSHPGRAVRTDRVGALFDAGRRQAINRSGGSIESGEGHGSGQHEPEKISGSSVRRDCESGWGGSDRCCRWGVTPLPMAVGVMWYSGPLEAGLQGCKPLARRAGSGTPERPTPSAGASLKGALSPSARMAVNPASIQDAPGPVISRGRLSETPGPRARGGFCVGEAALRPLLPIAGEGPGMRAARVRLGEMSRK